MAQTYYLRWDTLASNASYTNGAITVSGYYGGWSGGSSGWVGTGARILDPSPASSQSSQSFTDDGTTHSFALGQFISAPLASQTIASGNWEVGLATSQTGTTSYRVHAFIGVINGSTGALRGTIVANSSIIGSTRNGGGEGTDWGNAISGSALAVTAGDFLVVEYGFHYLTGGTLSVSGFVGGATAITGDLVATTDARAYVKAPANIALVTDDPFPLAYTWLSQPNVNAAYRM